MEIRKRTLQIPFTDYEWERLDDYLFHSGYKKQAYVRRLIVTDLEKTGWLQQSQEENKAQGASK